jgi:hypothetical protein
MDGQITLRVRFDCQYRHEHDQPRGVVTWAVSGFIPDRVRELGDFEELPEAIPGFPDPCRVQF